MRSPDEVAWVRGPQCYRSALMWQLQPRKCSLSWKLKAHSTAKLAYIEKSSHPGPWLVHSHANKGSKSSVWLIQKALSWLVEMEVLWLVSKDTNEDIAAPTFPQLDEESLNPTGQISNLGALTQGSSQTAGAQCRRQATQCSFSLKHKEHERPLFSTDYYNLFINVSPLATRSPSWQVLSF